MAYEPAMSGEIPMEGMLEVLRQIEERRISGRLRFTVHDERGQSEAGEVELVAGQLALNQDALPDGTDPVERLLDLRGGIFVVHQRLPPLAVAQGDEQNKKGSLAVHAPSDLMTYCEQAGLTGTLRLINAGKLVDMVYEAGELLGIRVDGQENADLSHVFSWEDGRFEIGVGRDVRSLFPGGVPEDPADREPTTQFVRPHANDTGKHFLKVLEVALTDIVDRRERAQHKGRGQTTLAAPPSVRPRPQSVAPPRPRKARRDATVQVVILGNDDDDAARIIDKKAGRGTSEPKGASPAPSAPTSARSQEDDMAKKSKDKSKKSAPKNEEQPKAPAASVAERPAKKAEKAAPPKDEGARADALAAASAPAGTSPTPPPAIDEGPLATAGWMALVVVVGVVILGLLARLPT